MTGNEQGIAHLKRKSIKPNTSKYSAPVYWHPRDILPVSALHHCVSLQYKDILTE